MKVIDIKNCRDMFTRWQELKQYIVQGRGFVLCVKDMDGAESIFVCGDYEKDSTAALGAALDMSMQLTRRAKEIKNTASGSSR